DGIYIHNDGEGPCESRPDITNAHPSWQYPGWTTKQMFLPGDLKPGSHTMQARILDLRGMETPLSFSRNFMVSPGPPIVNLNVSGPITVQRNSAIALVSEA